jgi:hypothetical protein
LMISLVMAASRSLPESDARHELRSCCSYRLHQSVYRRAEAIDEPLEHWALRCPG